MKYFSIYPSTDQVIVLSRLSYLVTFVYDSYLIIDDCGDGQEVENFAAVTPRVGVAILVLTLVIKPVHCQGKQEKRESL